MKNYSDRKGKKEKLFPEGIGKADIVYFVSHSVKMHGKEHIFNSNHSVVQVPSEALDLANYLIEKGIKPVIKRTLMYKGAAFGTRRVDHQDLTYSELEEIAKSADS